MHLPADAAIPERPQWPIGKLVTLSAGVCLSVTTELLPTGVLPAMSRELDVSQGTVGILVSGYAFVVALFAAPLTVATARLPRRTLLVATLLGYTVSNLVMVVSTVYPVALVARLGGGVTHGLFWGMLGGYVARIVAPERLGRSLTIASAGGVAATLLTVPAGTAVAAVIGWRGSFALLAGLGLAASAAAWRVLPNLPGRASRDRLPMPAVARIPGLMGLVITTTAVILGHFCFFTYVAPYLLHLGVPESRMGLALLGYGLMGALGLGGASVVVDRHLRGAMVTAAAVLAACFAGLALGTPPLALGIALVGGTGMMLGCLPIFMQAAVIRLAPQAPEAASALNASAFNTGIAGGAFLGGLLVDHLGAGVLPVGSALLCTAGVVAIVLDRRVGRVAVPVPAPAGR